MAPPAIGSPRGDRAFARSVSVAKAPPAARPIRFRPATSGYDEWTGAREYRDATRTTRSKAIGTAGKLSIDVPARPENVAAVRREVTAYAEKLGLAGSVVADLKTVVSEACANLVLHAYGAREPGPLRVELAPDGSALRLVVRNEGRGIHRAPPGEKPDSMRLGLQLIAGLSCGFRLSSSRRRGTRLEVTLPSGIA
jgi:serine/threonine-protein kinase RsbW